LLQKHPKAASKGGCSQDWPPYKTATEVTALS
jgi:hypothetical protein